MNKSTTLDGVIDMHVHTSPDICNRNYNDLELTISAIKNNARAIVIKGHHASTVARATICNYFNKTNFTCNSFTMFGGLVLNYEAGGLNFSGVKTALMMGAKIIWLPTVDAENEYKKRGKKGGISVFDGKKRIKDELKEIFRLMLDYDCILATGHISPEETLFSVECARNIGLKKIVITHPEYWIVNMPLDIQRRLITDYDVVLERCFMQPYKTGKWISNAEINLNAIKEIGTNNTILSTDCGNPNTPKWEEAMSEYLAYMSNNGISSDDLYNMTRKLPAKLLSIEL